jgi:elongation factor Ts
MSGPDENLVEAQRWLRFADEDLQSARNFLRSEPPRTIGFFAQQAAEKAIKSLLVLLNIRFPHVHDLERLQSLLAANLLTKQIREVPELTGWAVESRYPGEVEPSQDDAIRAVALAEDVVKRAHEDFVQLSRRSTMPEITATMVNQLRAKTGQGMMECKKVLVEAGGDVDKAVDLFRKRGVKGSIAERAASEGRIAGVAADDGSAAALVEVNCNTDFTAKSEPFLKFATNAARVLLHNPNVDLPTVAEVNSNATEVSQTTGENIRIGKTAYLKAPAGGKAGLYLYGTTGKIAVIMAFTGNPSEELITDIGGHIAFTRPVGLNRSEVPADLVAKEKELAVEQAKATGKPQNIAEKIAEGKLNSFFAERVLLDQEFYHAQKFKGSVQNYLKQSGVTLEKYVRLEVGQA